MQLRAANEADYAAIVELANIAYRGSGEEAGWCTESSFLAGPRLSEADLRADLASTPRAHLLIGCDGEAGAPLGTVWLEPSDGDAWYLGLLTIRPEAQNRGLGRELLEAAERFAGDRGARRIRMSVISIRDTLIAWYQRRGYVLTGETEPFPYDDTRFGRPLRGDLRFVILEKPLY
jgi:ribosomal protein S18 acetylase RimI-like enzyme